MYKKVCQGSLSRNISILLIKKLYKKVPLNGENAYLVMKYPRASRALRQAPDPTLKRARFARTMLLHTVGNLGLSRSGGPLPVKSWIHPCTNNVLLPGMPLIRSNNQNVTAGIIILLQGNKSGTIGLKLEQK